LNTPFNHGFVCEVRSPGAWGYKADYGFVCEIRSPGAWGYKADFCFKIDIILL